MLTVEDFRHLIDSTCLLEGPGGSFEAVLTECRETGPGSFTLLFTAAADAPAHQGSYLIEAAGLPAEPVFLVPVHVEAAVPGVRYQAVFNRLPG
ncbi:MAG TPA: hypothetical protein VHO01_14565 [Jatrophihabitans sp.]|nr:hypothetical protein [Jatrophihabitans sp.]